RFPGRTQAAWLQELGKQRILGGLEPAIVTHVDKTGLQVLTRDGQQAEVAWETMKWARPFINSNAQGRSPQSPADVAQVGDLVRLQRL
ncbi:peptidase, partial [Pseudomonas sp. SIMBA_065]